MSNEQRCARCGNLSGHSPIDDATCAYRAATGDEIKRLAVELGVDQVQAFDLLAHLRTLGNTAAFVTARYVMELGWRPTVGTNR